MDPLCLLNQAGLMLALGYTLLLCFLSSQVCNLNLVFLKCKIPSSDRQFVYFLESLKTQRQNDVIL